MNEVWGDPLDDPDFLDGVSHLGNDEALAALQHERVKRMSKDDPLQQSTISDQVRSEMAKHTLWLNAENFEEAVKASYEGYMSAHGRVGPAPHEWAYFCAAALAVVEWRMTGRIRP